MTTIPHEQSTKPMADFPRPVDSDSTDVCNTCNCDFDVSELTICSICYATICDNCSVDNPFSVDNIECITEYYCEDCQ